MVGGDARVRRAEQVPDATKCSECDVAGEVLLRTKSGAVCLDCAGLGHLEFLPAGSAALTRRAVKFSRSPVVVMQKSLRRFPYRGQSMYERQGILAEPAAIEAAALASLADAGVPGTDGIAELIRELFPGCPTDRAAAIALHTAASLRGRGRQRLTALEIGAGAVCQAVTASVLHVDTEYDELVASGLDRETARARVFNRVKEVLRAWRDGVSLLDT
ncbi:hypothetical protein A5790_02830 [Mycobacterium sp. 852002-51152_SCH6134967]|uniref:DUF2293 domain-containing protein n=1 Tax=Mycobacterium sp. 852002-51152_SCH6134967 TaxID=1834096 RepID=UPI0007FC1F65|nr:DUF2293 domain-containing protein [Mycobacterium sp. 852002-51152_SCH6134967]OBF98681.1 hypothetical protein A5790_02830 [Mycobacterium sp. 852002-51152_SCH6134967]